MFIIGVGKDFQMIPLSKLFPVESFDVCGTLTQSLLQVYASFHEIDIRFQFRYRETYPKAIMLVSEGLIDLKPLVTHRYTLDEAKQAFDTASTPSARAVKVQLLDD